MVLRETPASRKDIPAPLLPEMILRLAPVVPPMTLKLQVVKKAMPPELGILVRPSELKPMMFACTVLSDAETRRIPESELPEIVLSRIVLNDEELTSTPLAPLPKS